MSDKPWAVRTGLTSLGLTAALAFGGTGCGPGHVPEFDNITCDISGNSIAAPTPQETTDHLMRVIEKNKDSAWALRSTNAERSKLREFYDALSVLQADVQQDHFIDTATSANTALKIADQIDNDALKPAVEELRKVVEPLKKVAERIKRNQAFRPL